MRTASRTSKAAMLIMVMTAVTSCQSEEEGRDEELRNELRSAIETIEGKQSEHVEALKQYAELRNELNSEHNSMMSNMRAQAAQRELQKASEKYGKRLAEGNEGQDRRSERRGTQEGGAGTEQAG